MANKRVTSKEDPLVPTIVYLPKSQKDYLATQTGSTSRIIRDLINIHMQRPMEKMQVVESIKDAKIKLARDEAHLKQIEETESRAISLKTSFETRKKKALGILVREFTDNRKDFSKLKKTLDHYAEGLKISRGEIQALILEAVKVKEVKR